MQDNELTKQWMLNNARLSPKADATDLTWIIRTLNRWFENLFRDLTDWKGKDILENRYTRLAILLILCSVITFLAILFIFRIVKRYFPQKNEKPSAKIFLREYLLYKDKQYYALAFRTLVKSISICYHMTSLTLVEMLSIRVSLNRSLLTNMLAAFRVKNDKSLLQALPNNGTSAHQVPTSASCDDSDLFAKAYGEALHLKKEPMAEQLEKFEQRVASGFPLFAPLRKDTREGGR